MERVSRSANGYYDESNVQLVGCPSELCDCVVEAIADFVSTNYRDNFMDELLKNEVTRKLTHVYDFDGGGWRLESCLKDGVVYVRIGTPLTDGAYSIIEPMGGFLELEIRELPSTSKDYRLDVVCSTFDLEEEQFAEIISAMKSKRLQYLECYRFP